jgi:hypothetical protein
MRLRCRLTDQSGVALIAQDDRLDGCRSRRPAPPDRRRLTCSVAGVKLSEAQRHRVPSLTLGTRAAKNISAWVRMGPHLTSSQPPETSLTHPVTHPVTHLFIQLSGHPRATLAPHSRPPRRVVYRPRP